MGLTQALKARGGHGEGRGGAQGSRPGGPASPGGREDRGLRGAAALASPEGAGGLGRTDFRGGASAQPRERGGLPRRLQVLLEEAERGSWSQQTCVQMQHQARAPPGQGHSTRPTGADGAELNGREGAGQALRGISKIAPSIRL